MLRIPSTPIVTRIPEYICADWIAYCHSRQMTQSEVMRRAIAAYVEADESSSDRELAMAAIIEESFQETSLRSGGKYVRRKTRWRGSLVPDPPSP